MSVNSVSANSFGAQTQAQAQPQEKKRSVLLPALAGTAVAGVAAAISPLGKNPKYSAAGDLFESSEAKAELGEITGDDDKAKAKIITDEIDARAAADKTNKETLDALYKDNAKPKISEVLPKIDSNIKLEDIQAVLTEDATKAATAQADLHTKLTEAAAKITESAKDPQVVTIGEGDKAVHYQVSKADGKGVASYVTGTLGEEKDGKKPFTATGAPEEISKLEEKVNSNKKLKGLAEALGITDKTKADAEVTRESAEKAFGATKKTISEEVTKAFEAIKAKLPKKTAWGKTAMWAAGGGLVAGALAMMLGGNKE